MSLGTPKIKDHELLNQQIQLLHCGCAEASLQVLGHHQDILVPSVGGWKRSDDINNYPPKVGGLTLHVLREPEHPSLVSQRKEHRAQFLHRLRLQKQSVLSPGECLNSHVVRSGSCLYLLQELSECQNQLPVFAITRFKFSDDLNSSYQILGVSITISRTEPIPAGAFSGPLDVADDNAFVELADE